MPDITYRLYTRKNRKTLKPVHLFQVLRDGQITYVYVAHCGAHGSDSHSCLHKSEAISLMSHPWDFCDKCYAIVEALASIRLDREVNPC